MKKEEIKIRVSSSLKSDFQDICELHQTTMSNKINSFIFDEVKINKHKLIGGKTFTKKLIRFGSMNLNNRLYEKHKLTEIKLDEDGLEYTELDRLNNEILYGQYGYLDSSEKVHKYNATHSVKNLKINGDWLEGDVTILNDSILPIIDNLVFRSRSFGIIDDNNVVQEWVIIGFDALLKTDDVIK